MQHLNKVTPIRLGSVQDLFDDMAQAFQEGRCEDFARVFEVPGTMYIGTGLAQVDTTEQVIDYIRQYRSNLFSDGYATSQATVLADDPAPEGKRRALVHWQHFDASGVMFREVFASYFMARTRTGAWRHTEVELVDDIPARFARGLRIETAHP